VLGASWREVSARRANLRGNGTRAAAACSGWLQAIALVLAATATSAVSCTDPIQRSKVIVLIDADSAVRSRIAKVEMQVEVQAAQGGGFMTRSMEQFYPNTQNTWPLTSRPPVMSTDFGATWQLTATGRNATTEDAQGGVAAQARVSGKLTNGENLVLRVVFESSCFGRSELCGYGQTCAGGNCVAANANPYGKPKDPSQTSGTPPDMIDAGTGTLESPTAGIVQDGMPCESEGARGCTGHGTRIPLLCKASVWHPEPECSSDERCDTSTEHRGECRPMARECINKMPDVPFCDAQELMRKCTDLVSSDVIACLSNERCVMRKDAASCDCKTGFTREGGRDEAECKEATTCAGQGGCDPLTMCSMDAAGKRVCSDCPPGFTGSGTAGCSPLLTSLMAAEGALVPAFSPTVFDYKLTVPLIVQRVKLTASAPEQAQITLNGAAIPSGSSAATQVLALGSSMAEVVVRTERGVPTAYRIAIERTGLQSAYLKASKPGQVDHFGFSMAASGDTLVVGAFYEDSKASGVNGDDSDNSLADSGAAYVFVRNDGKWTQEAYLKAGDPASNGFFGTSVAISGDTIAVGQIDDDIFYPNIQPTRPGAVYVFTRQGTAWTQQQKLMAAAGEVGDMFGFSVALDGDKLIGGAPRGDTTAQDSGTAYLFTRDGSTWTERYTFKPDMPAGGAFFGSEVGISGMTAVVGAQEEGISVTRGGGAYVFEGSGSSWSMPLRLQPPMPIQDATFGFGLAIHGNTIAVGAPRAEFIPSSLMRRPPGEVYMFERGADGWGPTVVLKAGTPMLGDYFGFSISLTDDAMFVGAPGESSDGRGLKSTPKESQSAFSGAAFLFARNGRDWTPNGYFKASNADTEDGFGYNVSLTETVIAVSAIYEASNASGIDGNQTDKSLTNAGAVYVFE
jgi:hypothetical protein